MPRVYADTSDFRSPYDSPNLMLSGLGASPSWGRGRRYFDVSKFRRPYQLRYFQDNSLMGVPDVRSNKEALAQQLPPNFARFVRTGEPMPTLGRDVAAMSAQVPQWLWLALAAASGVTAAVSYHRFRKAGKSAPKKV